VEKSEYFFSNIGNQNIFLGNKNIAPPPWKLNGPSLSRKFSMKEKSFEIQNCLSIAEYFTTISAPVSLHMFKCSILFNC
jgi:hypothetical protein